MPPGPRKDAQRNRERLIQAATEAFAAGAQPPGAQPAGAQPPGAQPADAQPAGAQSAGAQSVGVRSTGVAFADVGSVRLEDIAKAAGVGVGTLYRNFPSREALVEEVYRTELTRLSESAPELLAAHSSVEALRTWMRRYQDFVATKRGMAETLRAVIASGAVTSGHTREQLSGAIGAMLAAGIADGTMRADVRPLDVAASLAGVMLAAADPAQATRMLDLLVEGCRPH